LIHGYFVGLPPRRRAFVSATFLFPSLRVVRLGMQLLIDTGADRTVLSCADADGLGTTLAGFPAGPLLGGVGGRISTSLVDAVLLLGSSLIPLVLTIPMPNQAGPSIPSILGRDILSRYALVVEERTDRILLLEPREADLINWP
jgi:predicted aspartyl protease